MKHYRISLSETAKLEYDNYIDFIRIECAAPLTAARHFKGIDETINSLKTNAEMYLIQTHPSLLRYGLNVRRINYKKIAIIYTIQDNIVFIHRIMVASLITK